MNPFRSPDAGKRLVIYLNDHQAVIAGELSLAQRCRESNVDTDLGRDLTSHIGAVAADRDCVEEMIRELDGTVDHVKTAAATVGEWLGRFKTNGQLVGYSPLSRVLEIEGLMSAARMRESMWGVLEQHAPVRAIGSADRCAEEAASVGEQIDRLRQHLPAASVEAFDSQRRST